MAGEWMTCTLADVGPIITGKTPATSDSNNFGGEIPFITPTDLDGSRFVHTTGRTLTTSGAELVRGSQIPAGAVLVSCIGSDMGKAALATRASVTNQQINSIIVQPPHLPLYVYYDLSQRKTEIRQAAGGSAQPILNKSAFGQLSIVLPPPTTQHAMAHILGTLDDKIELNRRMSETLEEMARALFKSWFVDFDPVRAKAEGRKPAGMAAEMAKLFPNEFEGDEPNQIPAGWETRSLYDSAKYINGAAYRDFDFNAERKGLPIIKIAELKGGITPQTKFTEGQVEEKYRIDTGSILFSWSGNPDTSIDTFVWMHGPAWLNQHIFKVEPNAPAERLYVFYLLKHLRPVFADIARDKQTTGLGHVTSADMKRMSVVHPPKTVLDKFNKIVAPIHDRWFANLLEISSLQRIRDELLPKLLSGELRISDAERFLEGSR